MSVYLSEEEQIQMIKQWWNKYGNAILSTVLGLLVILLCYQWWHRHVVEVNNAASSAFMQVQESSGKNDGEGVRIGAGKLTSQFPKSVYSALGAFMVARFDVQDSKFDDALQELQWIISNSHVASFREIARIRAAKILLFQGKAKECLDLLATVDDDTFMPMIANTRGDAYVALGQKDHARTAYTLVLQMIPESAPTRSVIKMKLNELATPEKHVAETRLGEMV